MPGADGNSGSHRIAAYGTAILIAICYGLYLFPLDFIGGTGAYWDSLRADSVISIIGMRYFLADAWHLPLLQTKLLMPPDGINIIYTDSVPLFALLAKAFRFLLPENFNYFGVYYLSVYVLQAVTAVYLLRSLSIRSLLPQVAIVVIVLAFPAFLFRSSLHASLISHFLLLWALGLYFNSVTRNTFNRSSIWFASLLCCALLIHAYLFIMALAIYAAAAMQHMVSGRKQAIEGVAISGFIGIFLLLVMWTAGYFEGLGKTLGFGHYSMNLLSPWVPQRSGIFPGMQEIIDATGGQYEGFNYLGLGVLLLLVVAVTGLRGNYAAILRRYWALNLVLVAFLILALSNRVFIGDQLLFEVGPGAAAELPVEASHIRQEDGNTGDHPASMPGDTGIVSIVKEILQQFRSSGRFFWPIGYLMLAGSLSVVARRFTGKSAVLIILLAVLLQVLDTGPLRKEIRDKFSARIKFSEMPESLQHPPDIRWQDSMFDGETWRPLIGLHEKLTVIPSFECAGIEKRWDVLDLLYNASYTATPSNTAYLARRPESADCSGQIASLAGYKLEDGEILVVLAPPVPLSSLAAMNAFNDACRKFPPGYACTKSWQDSKTDAFKPGFQTPNEATGH